MKTSHFIDLKLLEKSPLNTRRSVDKAGLEELQASLLSHGLMQNLVVSPEYPDKNGKYQVIAGARRLHALQQLQKDGKIPADYQVPCQIAADENALEMSLAENTIRHAMHPADEFQAYAALSEGAGALSTDKIAARFGVKEKHVQQRLKLGRAHPELIQFYREGKLKLDALEAFTLTDDKEQQIKTYKGLGEWEKSNPRLIRSALTKKMVPADNKIAKFVGVPAYLKAGGNVLRNLFSEDQYFEDTALLTKLAVQKLEAVAEDLRKAGWAWIEVAIEKNHSLFSGLTRLQPTTAPIPKALTQKQTKIEREIEKLEEMDADSVTELNKKLDEAEKQLHEVNIEIESYTTFTPDQMKKSGCYITIDYDGTGSIEPGIVKKKHEKFLPEPEKKPAPKKEKADVSDNLKGDLRIERTNVARLALTAPANQAIAFDLLVFHLVKAHLANYAGHGPQVTLRQTIPLPPAKGKLGAALAKRQAALPLAWHNRKDPEAVQFAAFILLTIEKKLQLLAWCVAVSLDAKLGTDDYKQPGADELAFCGTGFDVAAHWRPTTANYLGRVTKDQLIAIGVEIFGPAFANDHKNDSKMDLVEYMDAAFADPVKATANMTIREKLQNWLPLGMAFLRPAEKKDSKKTKPTAKQKKAA